jgi:hypothetical protein
MQTAKFGHFLIETFSSRWIRRRTMLLAIGHRKTRIAAFAIAQHQLLKA